MQFALYRYKIIANGHTILNLSDYLRIILIETTSSEKVNINYYLFLKNIDSVPYITKCFVFCVPDKIKSSNTKLGSTRFILFCINIKCSKKTILLCNYTKLYNLSKAQKNCQRKKINSNCALLRTRYLFCVFFNYRYIVIRKTKL